MFYICSRIRISGKKQIFVCSEESILTHNLKYLYKLWKSKKSQCVSFMNSDGLVWAAIYLHTFTTRSPVTCSCRIQSRFLKIEGYRGIDVAYTAHLQLLTSLLNVFRSRLLLWCGVSWQKQRAAVPYVLWFIYWIVQFKINLLSLLLLSPSFSLSLHSEMLLFAFGCMGFFWSFLMFS